MLSIKPLTKEEFRAQFNTEVTLSDKLHSILVEDSIYHGYVIYRCLDKLILVDTDGKYYAHFENPRLIREGITKIRTIEPDVPKAKVVRPKKRRIQRRK